MDLRGVPSNVSRNQSDHGTANPQLAGCSGSTSTPAAFSAWTQPPSEPSCGQLAPPSASTVASACMALGPSGVSNPRALSGSQPRQRWRSAEPHPVGIEPAQPGAQQRRGLERGRKDAPAGADEGLDAEIRAPRSKGTRAKDVERRLDMGRRHAVAGAKRRRVLVMCEVQPAASCQQELAARRGHAIVDGDSDAALREDLGSHEPGGPAPMTATVGLLACCLSFADVVIAHPYRSAPVADIANCVMTYRGGGVMPRSAAAPRTKTASAVIDALEPWLRARLENISQKGKLAEAIRYALSRWEGLIRFLDDGRIELDSNTVERAIRPLALNRKNSLFAGSDGGGQHWANLASLVKTCMLNGVEPQA